MASTTHGLRATYLQGCRCRPCTDSNTAYTREWKRTDKGKAAAKRYRTRRRLRVRSLVDELKACMACSDCGNYFPPECMDFDHTEDNKLFDVAKYNGQIGWERLWDEITKCELVCANCHRIRTKQRRTSQKGA